MRVIPAKSYQPPIGDTTDRSYEDIKVQIFWILVILSGALTLTTFVIYGVNIALGYGLGACAGMVYLSMLAKSVEGVGSESGGLGSPRLAIFIAVMIVALRWEQLSVLPVFLGFVTYKGAILLYAIQDMIRSSR